MTYVAAIHGNTENGIFSHMMVYNKEVCSRRHGGRPIPFNLQELKESTHAFLVCSVNEYDESEYNIEQVFLNYDQALKFTLLCSIIKHNESMKESFYYEDKPKRVIEKYQSNVEQILATMEKVGLAKPEMMNVVHPYGLEISFIDVDKLTYMHGNSEQKFESGFWKNNEKFHITPVSIVLPLLNGEIHPFAKTEINYASFND